jgi:dTDP-4-amino-4,6-dideoxygalactose transaminase
MIAVTKTFLPPIEEFQSHIQRAWDNHWLTNRGALVLELEHKLKKYLNVSNILITNNGTVPLQIALKLVGNQGEIVTTPFSYVATASAIVWEHCKPVFVDIDPEYFTIDETKIEAAITSKTTAILATHVFGNPCNVERIYEIATRHRLKVIYDAAHCFGVTYKGKSIFEYGDISTCSFHATKIFHTGEGGAVFCKEESLYKKIFYSHNFGHDGPLSFHGLGINGKISELQAAMGLSVFPYLDMIMSNRKKAIDYYNIRLRDTDLQLLKIRDNTEWNFSYYPVLFKDEDQLLRVEKLLTAQEILPRRYFYPSLNTIEYMKGGPMPVSENVAGRILCLPLFADIAEADLERICQIVIKGI